MKRRRRIHIENSQTAEEALATPVERAIDRVAQTDRVEPTIQGREIKLVVLQPLVELSHDAHVNFAAPPPDTTAGPTLLVWDSAVSAWRGLILPGGSRWALIPEADIPPAKPALWTP